MAGDESDLGERCLTRSDIAKFLHISAKQAGHLMKTMNTISVGRTHRRVTRADFDTWLQAKRDTAEGHRDVGSESRRASRKAIHPRRGNRDPARSVRVAAMKLSEKMLSKAKPPVGTKNR